jgi:hypothetical protein
MLRLPRRFSNQLEFGTSSSALTFAAGPAGSTAKKRLMGRKTIWSAASHANGDSYVSGTTGNARSSASCQSGSRSGKRVVPAQAASTAPSAKTQ